MGVVLTVAPCKKCGSVERTKAQACVPCKRIAGAKWSANNRDKVYASIARYKVRPEIRRKIAEQHRAWRANNPSRDTDYYRRHRLARRASHSKWAANNAGRLSANTSAYKARKLRRTPLWANRDAVRFFYDCCPAGYQVDHVIPLQGKTVSGLHVETNLQWLPAAVNASKHNRFASC